MTHFQEAVAVQCDFPTEEARSLVREDPGLLWGLFQRDQPVRKMAQWLGLMSFQPVIEREEVPDNCGPGFRFHSREVTGEMSSLCRTSSLVSESRWK